MIRLLTGICKGCFESFCSSLSDQRRNGLWLRQECPRLCFPIRGEKGFDSDRSFHGCAFSHPAKERSISPTPLFQLGQMTRMCFLKMCSYLLSHQAWYFPVCRVAQVDRVSLTSFWFTSNKVKAYLKQFKYIDQFDDGWLTQMSLCHPDLGDKAPCWKTVQYQMGQCATISLQRLGYGCLPDCTDWEPRWNRPALSSVTHWPLCLVG